MELGRFLEIYFLINYFNVYIYQVQSGADQLPMMSYLVVTVIQLHHPSLHHPAPPPPHPPEAASHPVQLGCHPLCPHNTGPLAIKKSKEGA